MKNNLLMLAAFAVLSGTMSAQQPVLTNNVFPELGDAVTQIDGDTLGIEPGASGANQTWNFSSLSALPGEVAVASTVATAASTPFAANFPDANLAAVTTTDDGTAYAYFKQEANKISFYGSAAGGIFFQFTDPQVVLQTPLNYHDAFTDSYNSEFSIPDGGTFYSKAIKAAEYDAYGTLKMPGATYSNAMRVKSVELSIDSTVFDGGYIVTILNTTTYEWYVANRPGPQVSVSYSGGHSKTVIPGIPPFEEEVPVTKSVNFVTNVTTAVSETPEQRLGIQIEGFGPNPAVETITLRFNAEPGAGELQVMVLNTAGQMLQSQVLKPETGENILRVPVAQLPAGQYLISVSDGKAVKTLPWFKA